MNSRTTQKDVTLYSTGNYIQYPEINHNGKEYLKGYIRLNQFAVIAEINNTDPMAYHALIT